MSYKVIHTYHVTYVNRYTGLRFTKTIQAFTSSQAKSLAVSMYGALREPINIFKVK